MRSQLKYFLEALFILVLATSQAASALTVPAEGDLASLMLDQNDPALYEEGITDVRGSSSLCGPASVLNWLQLETPLSRADQFHLLKTIQKELLKENTDINRGMIEPQVIRFLQIMDQHLSRKHDYVGAGRFFSDSRLTAENIMSDDIQILLLKYEGRFAASPTGFQGGRPKRPRDPRIPIVDETVFKGFHFVLKIAANPDTQEIVFIDSENPGRYSRARLGTTSPELGPVEIRVFPKTSVDLGKFGHGGPLRWSVLSTIQKTP